MQSKHFFEYTDTEVNFLKAKDPVLGKAIDEIGHIHREVIPDMFLALINSIIGQQISTKAQETIWQRFLDMFAPVTPQSIAAMPVETIRTCGISMKKALYIQEIAAGVMDGSLDLEGLQAMPDALVCKRLSKLKGIGVWTAQMLMIFSMQRKDVISYDDMAIIRGLRMLYGHEEITPQLFQAYQKRYSPYATIASLYLWRISHGACAGLADPAPTARGPAKKKVANKKDTNKKDANKKDTNKKDANKKDTNKKDTAKKAL